MVQTYERNEKQLTAKQLYEIQQAEIRHERALKRKRREERIARAKRSEREVAKHRVSSKWFRYLAENDIFPKVRDKRMVENVTIEQLEVGDNIWFRRPESYSTTGIVRELHFNGGKPYAVVEVGKHTFNISNHYEIAKVEE